MRFLPSRSASATVFAGLLVLSAMPWLNVSPALAVPADPPSCQRIEQSCLNYVEKLTAKQAQIPQTADRPHMTADECYDSYHKAQGTGQWPAHLPLNFAINCTN